MIAKQHDLVMVENAKFLSTVYFGLSYAIQVPSALWLLNRLKSILLLLLASSYFDNMPFLVIVVNRLLFFLNAVLYVNLKNVQKYFHVAVGNAYI